MYERGIVNLIKKNFNSSILYKGKLFSYQISNNSQMHIDESRNNLLSIVDYNTCINYLLSIDKINKSSLIYASILSFKNNIDNIYNSKVDTSLNLKSDINNIKLKNLINKNIESSSINSELVNNDFDKINTELCSNFIAKFPVNTNYVDLKEYYKFKNLIGVDIFNKTESFFNNICYTYSSNNSTDITLTARNKMFSKLSKCTKDCNYLGIDEHGYSICNCKSEPNNVQSIFESSLLDSINKVNLNILKCYNFVFKSDKIFKNIGFLIELGLLLLMIVYIVIYLTIFRNKFLLRYVKDIINNDAIFILNNKNSNKHWFSYKNEFIYFANNYLSKMKNVKDDTIQYAPSIVGSEGRFNLNNNINIMHINNNFGVLNSVNQLSNSKNKTKIMCSEDSKETNLESNSSSKRLKVNFGSNTKLKIIDETRCEDINTNNINQMKLDVNQHSIYKNINYTKNNKRVNSILSNNTKKENSNKILNFNIETFNKNKRNSNFYSSEISQFSNVKEKNLLSFDNIDNKITIDNDNTKTNCNSKLVSSKSIAKFNNFISDTSKTISSKRLQNLSNNKETTNNFNLENSINTTKSKYNKNQRTSTMLFNIKNITNNKNYYNDLSEINYTINNAISNKHDYKNFVYSFYNYYKKNLYYNRFVKLNANRIKIEVNKNDLEILPLRVQLLIDNSCFFKYFCNNLIDNCLILNILYRKSILNPLLIRFSELFLNININIMLNAFFYTDDYVDQRNNAYAINPSTNQLNYIILNEFWKSVWASLITLIIINLINLIINVPFFYKFHLNKGLISNDIKLILQSK